MPLRDQCPAVEWSCSKSAALPLRILKRQWQFLLMHFLSNFIMFVRDTWMLRGTSHSLKNNLAHFHKLCSISWLFSFFAVVVQQLSHVWLCDPMDCKVPGFLSFTISWTHVHWVSDANHLILCCLLLLSSVFPSIKVFFRELALPIRWPKY